MSEQTDKTTKKKMKKVTRFLRGLKRLLCCCWGKTRQQDEEAEQYVAARSDSPRLAEGEQGGECEQSDSSVADSSSETAQSLQQVTCGQSPERESVQSLSEERVAVEDLVSEASQDSGECGAYIDEALIESIYALIEDEEPAKPPAAEAPVCVKATPSPSGEQGEAEGQAGRRAARHRRRRKKKVHHEEEDDGGEWQLVCDKRKKNKKKQESVTKEAATPAPVTPAKLEAQRISRKPREPRRGSQQPHHDRDRVRQSWQESTVKVVVPVPPHRRRHVIGTRGDTLRLLQQQYPAVRVSVPPPKDFSSQEVTIEGPKTQVDAAAQQITLRLQAVEEQRRQARQTVVKVEVAPHMRGHVVGYRGEALRRLAQEHPAVTVMVPRPSDTQTASVSIRGPREEAAVVAERIKTCVQAAADQRQRQQRHNKRKQ